jgi:hypothetical protein
MRFQEDAIQEEKEEIELLKKSLENMKVPFGFVS